MNQSTEDEDATRFIPAGGVSGKRPQSPLQAMMSKASSADSSINLNQLTGLNPLLAAANPVLVSIPALRQQLNHPDPQGLRETQLQQIRTVEDNLSRRGVAPEVVATVSYVLCTFIDETVAATPWGFSPEAAKHSLLVTLHRETSGGERFFYLLDEVKKDPSRKLELLEFFYVCLAFGFEGRYRIVEGGKVQLEGLRNEVADLIKRQRGEYPRELSPNWRGEQTVAQQDHAPLKLWLTAAGAMLLLLLIYVFCLFGLSRASDELPLSSMAFPAPARPLAVPAPPPADRVTLTRLLQPQISAGQVTVRQEMLGEVVSIQGDGLFDSGQAEVKPEHRQILALIAAAVNQVPGEVLVVGHTDNVPSRSLQYPSNWHLSEGRALAVAALMRQKLAASRVVVAEGRGDLEPLVVNDSPSNKALNRRVEIVVKN